MGIIFFKVIAVAIFATMTGRSLVRGWRDDTIAALQAQLMLVALAAFSIAALASITRPLFHLWMTLLVLEYLSLFIVERQAGGRLMRQMLAGDEVQYREAVDLDPENAAAHLFLGNVLVKQGRDREALEHYRRSLEIEKDQPLVRTKLRRLEEQFALEDAEQVRCPECGVVYARKAGQCPSCGCGVSAARDFWSWLTGGAYRDVIRTTLIVTGVVTALGILFLFLGLWIGMIFFFFLTICLLGYTLYWAFKP